MKQRDGADLLSMMIYMLLENILGNLAHQPLLSLSPIAVLLKAMYMQRFAILIIGCSRPTLCSHVHSLRDVGNHILSTHLFSC